MPNNKRKHYDVIIAWANGAEVEAFSSGSGVWVNCPHPNFFEYMQYRIKQRTFTESAWYPVEVNRELGGVAQYVQGSFKCLPRQCTCLVPSRRVRLHRGGYIR